MKDKRKVFNDAIDFLTADAPEGGVSMVSVDAIAPFRDHPFKLYNSLIVTMTDLSKAADTLGYGALIPLNNKRTYLHNQRIGLVQMISDELPKDYIYWFLRSYEYQKNIINSATGSTVKHTSPDRICMQEIPIPSIEDLENYESILESIDSQIAKNNLSSQELEGLRDALLPKLMSGELDVSDIDI